MSRGSPPTQPQSEIPIASQPFPGSLTPGWNDPPSIQYNPQTASITSRTKLNKRVPFPLQQGLPPTTKPTAIVQPCQTTMLGATGVGGNIAVVHPMQYPNQMSPPISTFPTLPGNTSSNQTPTPTPSPPQTSCASVNVPTMSVPAVPRQNNANESIAGTNVAISTSSTIQHI